MYQIRQHYKRQKLQREISSVNGQSTMLKSEQRQRKPWRGTSAMDEPKVWFKYEQQVQQIFTLSDPHGTINHTLERKTSQLSLIVWSSLPTYDSQGTVSHTSKQKFNDIVKWSVIPTTVRWIRTWKGWLEDLFAPETIRGQTNQDVLIGTQIGTDLEQIRTKVGFGVEVVSTVISLFNVVSL